MLGFSLRPLFGQQRRPSRSSRAKLQPRLCLEILENRLVPSTLHVGSNKQFHTIQDAVNAAHSNDTIKVAPGTYQEQVVIGSGKDGIRLAGSGQNATIKAPAVLTGAHAVVQVSGAQNVTIQGFTIEGPASTSNSGGNLYGVRIDGGGSATVMHNHITKIHNTPFNGVQEGIAIVVGQASASQTGSAVISHNTIDNYQKGGIVVSNTGSSAAIEHNTIVGAGPTALIAQNGIQISSGATAHVTRNSISGNQYAPQTAAATGILLFSPGAVTIDHNTLSNNDVGIYSIAATALDIDHNKVTASTFIGILLDTTTGARVSDNTTDKAGDAGIALLNSTNNTIDHNESANNDGDGIFVDSASTGNVFDRNRLTGNGNFDAEDLSTGSGTAGTGNTWTKNKGKTSSPPGLVS